MEAHDIEFCYWGNTHNNYVGVWGITNHIVPLINEVSKKLSVVVDCQTRGMYKDHTTFTNILNIKPKVLELDSNITIDSDFEPKAETLFIEARTFDLEKQYCIKKINSYLNRGKLVMILDNNLWAKELPERCRKNSMLLKPYIDTNPFFSESQKTFHYNIHSSVFDSDKPIDLCYIGNEYERSNDFLKFFNSLNESGLKVVVAGDWLREDKFARYSHLNNIQFIGELPHSLVMPLLAKSKATLQIVKPLYKSVGLMSNRLFEAAMSNCLCFADSDINFIDKFVDTDLLVENGEDLISKFELYNSSELHKKKFYDLLREKYSVEEQARKIEKYVGVK